MQKLAMDFRKGKVDILAIHRFISAMLLGDSEEQAKYYDHSGAKIQVGTKSGIGGFVAWLGGDSVEQDTAVTDVTLHSDPPILMTEEHVERCYKSGRDLFVYTTHRVLLVDVQGLLGKKVAYTVSKGACKDVKSEHIFVKTNDPYFTIDSSDKMDQGLRSGNCWSHGSVRDDLQTMLSCALWHLNF
jgi:hypothetical protein